MKNLMCIIISLFFVGHLSAQYAFTYRAWDGAEVNLSQRMDEINIPGLSIAVVKDGQLLLSQQWGVIDRESQKAVEANTLFQGGSLTGALTAIVTLQAVEEGKIDLDTDINQYLRTWKLPENKFSKDDPVNVLDLLSKRRGFTQNQKPKGYTKGSKVPNLQQILNGEGNTKAIKLRSATHDQQNYSFETELILQQLLEDVYQKDYRSLVQERIFDVLEMNNSTLNLHLDEDQKERTATGYLENDQAVEGGWLIFPEAASAGLWTTAEEYAKLALSLMKAYNGDENQLLSPSTVKKALNKVHNDKAMIFNNWGPGSIIGYGGAPKGYYATFESDPANNWSIIILTNKHIQWRFVNELRDGLKAKYELNTPSK